MTYIAVSQQVIVDRRRGTRNDALDHRWHAFLRHCGLVPLPLPNDPAAVRAGLAGLPVSGILLTGGNDLRPYGGDAPERDAAERELVEAALSHRLPLLGVCRGMQMLQHRFGVSLEQVTGHVTHRQAVSVAGRQRIVNSYHNWAATHSRYPLRTWAIGPRKVIKAVKHETAPLTGIMWHPERMTPFAPEDRALFQECFGRTS